MNILTAGLISCGKSSFVNSIAGGFICNVSLLKETINPTKFSFAKDGKIHNLILISNFLKNIKESNKNSSETKNVDNTLFTLPSPWNLQNFSIVDYPGFDSSILDNRFLDYLQQTDIVVYITDVTKSFATEKEIELFQNIKNAVDNQIKIGNIVDLVIVMNKYDNLDDEDFDVNYLRTKQIVGNIPIFRYSSHCVLLDYSVKNGRELYVPEIMEKEFNNKIKKKLGSDSKLVGPKNNYYSVVVNDETNGILKGDSDGFIDYIREINTKEYMLEKEKYFQKYCYEQLLKTDLRDLYHFPCESKPVDFNTKMTSGMANAFVDYVCYLIDTKSTVDWQRFIFLDIVFEYLERNKYYSKMLMLTTKCLTIQNYLSHSSLMIPIKYIVENYNFSNEMALVLDLALTSKMFYESYPMLVYKGNGSYEFEDKNLLQIAIEKKRLDCKLHKLLTLNELSYNKIKYLTKVSPNFFKINPNASKYSGEHYINNIIKNLEYKEIFGNSEENEFHELLKPIPNSKLLAIIEELN